MTDVTTLVRMRVVDRIHPLAAPMIADATRSLPKVDAVNLVRLKVDQIAPVLNRVAPMIAVVTRNHRTTVAVMPDHLRVGTIVGLTVLARSLAVPMIDAATSNRRTVVRAVTLVRRNTAPVMIVVASLRSMATVTIVDAATSVRRSVDRATIAAKWGRRRAIIVVVPIVVRVTLSRRTTTPIEDTAISVRRCTDQAASVATAASPPAVEATIVVEAMTVDEVMNVAATVVVRNRRCATPSPTFGTSVVVERTESGNASPRNSEGLLRFAFVVRNEPQCSRPNGAAWIFALRLGIIVREPVTQFLARLATGSASTSDPATGERVHVTACGDLCGTAFRK